MNTNKIETILGIDYGTKRIGLATAQTITKTASPLEIISNQDKQQVWQKLTKIIQKWQPNYIVIGKAINSDGSESDLAKLAQNFGNEVNIRYNLPVKYIDESLTSYTVRAMQQDKQLAKSKNKHIDSLAACLIIEAWLNSQQQVNF